MAKRRSYRRRTRGFGSVLRVRQTRGLGQINNPASFAGAALPATLGGLVAALTTVGLRHMMTPTTTTEMTVMQRAPLIGLATGLLTSWLLAMTSGRAAGIASSAGASAVSGALVLSEWAAKQRLAQVASGETIDAMRPYGLGRPPVGAIVMEPHASRGYGRGPMGAIVPEYSNTRGLGAYGDVVNLKSINPNAFGTPGFSVQGAR